MLPLASQQHQHQHQAVDLSEMLGVLANRIGEFKSLLENPKSVVLSMKILFQKILSF
jgi:hypothetical protein